MHLFCSLPLYPTFEPIFYLPLPGTIDTTTCTQHPAPNRRYAGGTSATDRASDF